MVTALLAGRRKRRLMRFRRSESTLREALLDHIRRTTDEAVAVIDDLGHLIFWNLAAEKLFGYPLAEVRGQEIHTLLAPHNDHVRFPRFIGSGRGSIVGETLRLRAITKARQEIEIELTVSPVRVNRRWHVIGVFREISDRRRPERKMGDALEMAEKIIAHAPLGIATYLFNGQCQSANEAMVQIVGAPDRAVVIAQNFHHLESWKRAGLHAKALETLETGQPTTHIFKTRTTFGKDAWLNCYLIPFSMHGQPQLLLLIADISELKSSELAAKESRDFIELLINTVPSPLFYKSISGAYLGCNDAFAVFFGKPLAEIVGNKAWSLLPPDAAALVETKDEELIANGVTHHYETQICRADGALRDVEYHKAVYRNTGCEPAGIVGVMLDITERKRAEALLRELATIDALTGLSNRRHFDEVFAIEWNRAQRTGAFVSLLMVDVDNFKLYNDHYGHQRGDKCLSLVAGAIRGACLRPSDFVARYGGEEFAVILPDVPCDGAMVVAERIRLAVLALEIDHSVVGRGALVTISVGVAQDHPTRDNAPSQLLQSADKALYNAKHAGKNLVAVG